MTDAAIIAGSLVDVRNVGTHKSVKLTIHVPEEYATRVVAAFGWPTGAAPVSVAIARLNEVPAPSCLCVSSQGEREPVSDPGFQTERGHRSPAQIAGYLSTLPAFHTFLREKQPLHWQYAIKDMGRGCNPETYAAQAIRLACNVKSRSEITKDTAEWSALLLAFKLWEREAEVVPA